ncbi:MAG: protein kinase [Deltaproteobacteria bacterium]|nr:MAG: protein kinase [Deltaproteobacteria bacterium]
MTDSSPAPRNIGAIDYDGLLNTYYQQAVSTAQYLDASCEQGAQFLKDLQHRLKVLNRAHQFTPDDNVSPEAVLRGNRAAFKHCGLIGENSDEVLSRLKAILEGTQDSPFIKKDFSKTKTIHEGPHSSSEVSLWENSDREIAIKRFKRSDLNLKVIPAYGFWMELAMTLGTESPHVVKALDFGGCTESSANDTFLFDICMESALQSFDKFMMGTESEDWATLGSILSLYAAAHEGELSPRTHLILRDIKPGNILIFPNQNFKLCDFALSVYERDLQIQEPQHHRIGTIGYIPPEAECEIINSGNPEFKNKKFLWSPQGDVYSLGVTLFEKLYFRGFDQATGSQLQKHMDLFLRNPQDRKFSNIPEKLKPFLPRCLTTDLSETPSGRYPDINQVKQAFQALQIDSNR